MSKLKDIKKNDKLGISLSTIENMYVNPLVLASSDEFNKPGTSGDYRKRAVERVIDAQVSFTSENNCIGELVNRLNLIATCPVTGEVLKFRHTGGNNSTATLQAKGKEVTINIALPYSAIDVTFNNEI